ncbi:MAG: HigA family addiction module antitoxin [Rhodospirillales bacterium]|jgi:addiction module HigA family antidote|nr:HigA family addiction module antitoxin [Rhodospirillales bacterium]
MGKKNLAPLTVHPGEILDHEFLRPNGFDADTLARAIGVDAWHVKGIIEGRRGIPDEMTNLLARHFGTTVEFWINLQRHYEGWANGKEGRGGAEHSGNSVEEPD